MIVYNFAIIFMLAYIYFELNSEVENKKISGRRLHYKLEEFTTLNAS
jgi:hypothetical protein